jgi:hypothetical protein
MLKQQLKKDMLLKRQKEKKENAEKRVNVEKQNRLIKTEEMRSKSTVWKVFDQLSHAEQKSKKDLKKVKKFLGLGKKKGK